MANIEKLGSSSPEVLLKNATNLDKLVNGRESESLPDRFGVLRKTWHGMEMIFSRFIDYITGRGEQAVAAIGWQELGNWAVGLAVDNRQQIVYYNGSWYKYLGELEHVIAGDSPENDGGVWSAANPTGKWSNIGDAALRSNLGSGEGFKYIGQVRSVAALALLPGTNGDRVLLASYHELTAVEMPVGGGEFYYSSTMAGVNNGVTIFNGWCRKIINNCLTDYDAGCRKGDTSDVSSRLDKLFAVLEDGMTITFHCKNKASKNFVIKNIPNIILTAVGDGGIYCFWARDNFTFTFDPSFEAGNAGMYGSLGILSFYNCTNFQVHHLTIEGIQKVLPASKEWGDCWIRYEACVGAKVFENKFSHAGGWGVFGGFGSDDSDCDDNEMSHIHRQSAINIWANSSNCHARRNKIFDAGLYGLECETFSNYANANTTGNSATDNIIEQSKIGLCLVGAMKDFLAAGNTISKCLGAAAAIGVNYANSTRIDIMRNLLKSSWYGMTANNCRNVLYDDNTVDYSEPDYLITDQYQAPVKRVDGDNYSFYCTAAIASGKIIKIAESVYTVASYSSISAQDLFGQATYYQLSTLVMLPTY